MENTNEQLEDNEKQLPPQQPQPPASQAEPSDRRVSLAEGEIVRDMEKANEQFEDNKPQLPPQPHPPASQAEHSDRRASLAEGEIVAGTYKILSLLGQGAVAVVYCVEQVFLHQNYAMKVLNAECSNTTTRRFQQEAQAAGSLEHPNLVKAYNFALLPDGRPFFIMDLIPGETLSQLLKRVGTLSIPETIDLFVPICDALAYAHDHNVIHRDIKPSNIILAQPNAPEAKKAPKIVDFGIARVAESTRACEDLTRTGEVFGTPFYMSPERCMGQRVDQRSDIYSLTCVLFEALTGVPPFVADSALGTMLLHHSQNAPSLKEVSLGKEFPQWLEELVQKGLSKNREERFKTCAEISEILSKSQSTTESEQQSIKARVKAAGSNKSWTRIFSITLAIFLLFLVASIAMSIFPIHQDNRTNTQSQNNTPSAVPVETIDSTLHFSSLAPRPYAKTERDKIHGVEFDFPTQPIGMIADVKSINDPPQFREARGHMVFAPDALILFRLEPNHMSNYRDGVLDGFNPGDLDGLTIYDRVADPMDLDYTIDRALVSASKFTALKRLDFVNIDEMTKKRWLYLDLDDLKNLECLSVTGCSPDSAGLVDQVNMLQRLKVLYINELTDGRALVHRLRNSDKMEILSLDNDNLTDEDLSSISTLKSLLRLCLRTNSKLTDAGIRKLASLTQLQSIDLQETRVTPAVSNLFKKFSHLVWLRVPGGQFSSKDIANLRSMLPNCDVSTEDKSRHHYLQF